MFGAASVRLISTVLVRCINEQKCSNKHMTTGSVSRTHMSCFKFTYRGVATLHTAPFIKYSHQIIDF